MEFPELDVHCEHQGCNQVDFLPFQCDCCRKTYCLEHRTYKAHSCPKAGDKDSQALVCPLCAKGVRLVPDEDPNITFERHAQTSCDPANYKRVNEKPRCPVKACNEKLTFSNTHTCKECRQKVCLKHRFPTDHQCRQGKAPAGAASAAGAAFLDNYFQRNKAASTAPRDHPQPSSRPQPKPPPRAAATRKPPSAGHDPARVEAQPSLRPQINGSEVCPHCRAAFHDVASLITHVEQYHPSPSATLPAAPNRGSGATSSGREVCPQCHKSFANVAALIRHVDTSHPEHGGSATSGRSDCMIQ